MTVDEPNPTCDSIILSSTFLLRCRVFSPDAERSRSILRPASDEKWDQMRITAEKIAQPIVTRFTTLAILIYEYSIDIMCVLIDWFYKFDLKSM